jgi:hypothetical protein
MLEIIVGIVLALSLFGNYQQHKALETERGARDYYQQVADTNRAEWLMVVEVNKNNVVVIERLKRALSECNTKLVETVDRTNDFRTASIFKDAAIRELEVRLSSADFAQCRVPDWVDLSNP